MILLIDLGFWQLHRAHDKRQLLHDFQQHSEQPPMTLAKLKLNNIAAYRYRNIMLTGYFDNRHQFLLDNRFYKNQVGYQVLTPFIPVGSKKALLINRGWLPVGHSRKHLPYIPDIQGRWKIRGFVDLFPKKTFVLKEIARESWPRLLPVLDFVKISRQLSQPIYPFIVLLAPHQRFVFAIDGKRGWHPLTMKPARHVGYAVQWFALALALLIIFIVVNTQRNDKP